MAVEDEIKDAVKAAIAANWSPTKMIEEIRSTWSGVLEEKRTFDDREFQRALK